jgi:tRNA threonylcarbamoyladenosine biosynthesis protein TsaB
VDTTSARESVALVDEQAVVAEVRVETVDGHSRRLMPSIAFLLETAGIEVAAVDGFAVAVGPGSFTGLRVGLSTVQGLALAARRPCLGLSVLEGLAAEAAGAAEALMAVVDAARDDLVYTALHDGQGRPTEEPRVEAATAAAARLPPGAAVVGDGLRRHRSAFESRRPGLVFPRASLYVAGALGRLAGPRFEAGEGVPPSALRALYLRPVDIRKAKA